MKLRCLKAEHGEIMERSGDGEIRGRFFDPFLNKG